MSRMRWGDTLDDEDVLPGRSESGPDANGVRTITEYYRNDKGDAMKKTTRIKTIKVQRKVYRVTQDRKKWPKFGLAAEKGNEGVTMRMAEDIPFERVRTQKQQKEDKMQPQNMDDLLKLKDKAMIGQGLRDILERKRRERQLMEMRGLKPEADKPPTDDEPARPSGASGPGGSSYIAPHLRGRTGASAGGDAMATRRRDENSVRVSNLAEDVTEADLKDLFSRIGPVSRVYVAYDHHTRESRGFAFVNFVHRSDAEKAIQTLDGHGYANLILHVEWAERR